MFAPASSFFPSNTVKEVIHYATQDRSNAHNNDDPDRQPIVASRFGKPHTSATVETTAFYDTSYCMSKFEPFAALLDFTFSEDNLGKVQFSMPHEGFVTRNSPAKCRKHAIELGGTFTPGCWVSFPHCDYLGGYSPIVHLLGPKLWYWFPRTILNASIMDQIPVMDTEVFQTTTSACKVLEQIEGLKWAVLDCPVGFIMDSFEYHGCLALEPTMHIGGPAWYPAALANTPRQINLMLDNMIAYVRSLGTKEEREKAFGLLAEEISSFDDALGNALGACELIADANERNASMKKLEELWVRIEVLKTDEASMVQ
jgi:hypothetical protein